MALGALGGPRGLLHDPRTSLRPAAPHPAQAHAKVEGPSPPPPSGITTLAPRFPARTKEELERVSGSFDAEMTAALSEPARRALAPKTSGKKDEASFGRAVGAAIAELASELERGGWRDQRALSVLDELIGVAVFARRAGRDAFRHGIFGAVDARALDRIEREVASRLPGDILAVVVGAGAMGIGLAELAGHAIRPGGHSWRSRIVVATPIPEEREWIERDGRYPPGTPAHANVPVVINHAEGPRIEAVMLADAGEAISKARSVLLMVPSQSLPEVASAIAPFVSSKTPVVEFTKGVNALSAQLPREVLLERLAKGAGTPPIVTIGGFCPAQDLHHGKSVTLSIASSADHRAAADEVRRLLSGSPGGANAYVQTIGDDHPLATELAGTLKNVVALMVGLNAVRAASAGAKAFIEHGDRGPEPVALIERIVAGALGPPASLSEPVKTDARECCRVDRRAVAEILSEAKTARIRSDADAVRWLKRVLLPRRTEIAPTRNVVVGVIAGILELWSLPPGGVSKPGTVRLDLGKILGALSMTMEGVASLEPLRRWMSNRGAPMPAELDDVYRRFSVTTSTDAPADGAPKKPHQQLIASLVNRR